MLLDRKFPHIIPIGADRRKVSRDQADLGDRKKVSAYYSDFGRSQASFHIVVGSERVLTAIAALMQLSDAPPGRPRQHGIDIG